MGRDSILTIAFAVVSAPSSLASPILLASVSNQVDRYGDAVIDQWVMNDAVRYSTITGSHPRLFEHLGVLVSVNAPPISVIQELRAGDDPDFDAFVALLTDGLPAEDSGLPQDLLINGRLGSESILHYHVPRIAIDLHGYEIESIVRRLTFSMESPGRNLNGDGNWTDFHTGGVYEFWGSPVPEPTTWGLLLIGAMSIIIRAARSSRL